MPSRGKSTKVYGLVEASSKYKVRELRKYENCKDESSPDPKDRPERKCMTDERISGLVNTVRLSQTQWDRNCVSKFVKSCMEDLRDVFGFQEDSCTAQKDHLVELWRSNIGEDTSPDACKDAIHRTHTRLLASYEKWLNAINEERVNIGVQCLNHQKAGITRRKLHECSLYLLVWGSRTFFVFILIL